VNWKNIPELPLIQPEKVITVPLDLTLDKTYVYRLVGREKVQGREAYVLEFRPADPEAGLNLYRGRVWIDAERFVRVKTSLVQGELEPPVLSNEEIDLFDEVLGPDGETYWMFSKIDGQQIWNAAGRSLVVRRELMFSEYRINPPRAEFEARRSEAYASSNQMLRDTDQGFRYLERTEEGQRVVKEEQDTSQLFAAAGLFRDNSQDSVVPLAGVNYFDYDLFDRNIQVNVLFAGVVGFFTASKPDMFGKRIDLTADAALSALRGDDDVYVGDDEVEEERIKRRTQTFNLRLGVPAGKFVKFNFIGSAAFNEYFPDGDADDAIADYNLGAVNPVQFVLPEEHVQFSGGVEAEFNRRGYTLAGEYRYASRSDWEPWGLQDTVTGEYGNLIDGVFVPSDEEFGDSFSRWGVTAFKEWYLPKFQKVRGTVNYLNGSDLDRFSRYEFSFFGEDRLNGFSGSGVRFDEGVIARAGYAFNVFEVVQLDAALESAWVEQGAGDAGSQSFAGLGLSANFVGPWKTVINFNYGYALASDIPDLEGEQEFLLLVFKLF
jgi:hypothetical protein